MIKISLLTILSRPLSMATLTMAAIVMFARLPPFPNLFPLPQCPASQSGYLKTHLAAQDPLSSTTWCASLGEKSASWHTMLAGHQRPTQTRGWWQTDWPITRAISSTAGILVQWQLILSDFTRERIPSNLLRFRYWLQRPVLKNPSLWRWNGSGSCLLLYQVVSMSVKMMINECLLKSIKAGLLTMFTIYESFKSMTVISNYPNDFSQSLTNLQAVHTSYKPSRWCPTVELTTPPSCCSCSRSTTSLSWRVDKESLWRFEIFPINPVASYSLCSISSTHIYLMSRPQASATSSYIIYVIYII